MARDDYLVLALTTVNVRLLNSKDITQMLKLLNPLKNVSKNNFQLRNIGEKSFRSSSFSIKIRI